MKTLSKEKKHPVEGGAKEGGKYRVNLRRAVTRWREFEDLRAFQSGIQLDFFLLDQ